MGTIVSRKRADGSRSHTGQIVIKKLGQIVHREAKTFDAHAAAVSWLRDRESELAKRGTLEKLQAPGTSRTLTDAIDHYTRETNKVIGRTKEQVLNSIKAYDIADLDCAAVTSTEIVAFAKQLLDGGRQPSTVGNYFSHLSAIFQIARPAWGYALDEKQMGDAQKVLTKMGIIGKSKSRDRRPTLAELDRLMDFFVERSIKRPSALPMHRVIALAIFTTRRQDEIARQQMADVEIAHKRMMVRDMKHPGEKIGNDVWCELTDEAIAIIKAMRAKVSVFEDSTADAISPPSPAPARCSASTICTFTICATKASRGCSRWAAPSRRQPACPVIARGPACSATATSARPATSSRTGSGSRSSPGPTSRARTASPPPSRYASRWWPEPPHRLSNGPVRALAPIARGLPRAAYSRFNGVARRRDPDRADCRNIVFSGVATMARHLLLAITLIGIAGLLNSPAQALLPLRCDDLVARCTLCPTPSGGVFPANSCMAACDRKVTACLVRAHDAFHRRWWR
jgi:integrase